jgi:hypothetical protein
MRLSSIQTGTKESPFLKTNPISTVPGAETRTPCKLHNRSATIAESLWCPLTTAPVTLTANRTKCRFPPADMEGANILGARVFYNLKSDHKHSQQQSAIFIHRAVQLER